MTIWNNAVDNILPWIDQLIDEEGDKTIIKISDIMNRMDEYGLNKLRPEYFCAVFSVHMNRRGYNIKTKDNYSIAIISKLKYIDMEKTESVTERAMKNVIENITGDEKNIKYEKKDEYELLEDIMAMVSGESLEYNNYVYELVVKKRNEIFETTGKKVSIKDIVEQAVRIGIDSVK